MGEGRQSSVSSSGQPGLCMGRQMEQEGVTQRGWGPTPAAVPMLAACTPGVWPRGCLWMVLLGVCGGCRRFLGGFSQDPLPQR